MYVKVHVYCNLLLNIRHMLCLLLQTLENKQANTLHQNTARKGNLDKTIIIHAGKTILNYSCHSILYDAPTSQAIQAGLSNVCMSFNVTESPTSVLDWQYL